MAELNCAVCDKEVGLPGQRKLAGGGFICKDCEKKVSPFFEPSECTIEQYFGNIKQNEEGQILFDAYFNKNKKAVKLCDNHVIYDPGTALLCISGERSGIFSSREFFNVFRLADLKNYEQTSRFRRGVDGSNIQIKCMSLSFEGVPYGISSYLIAADEGDGKKLIKEFDRILGRQTTEGGAPPGLTGGREELGKKADAAISEALKKKFDNDT